jgi:2-polyprenyl-3-methyl-5-hydroxy-6-metoxy-1,4-benzoquinol methylase
MERIYLSKKDLEEQENHVRYWRHIERYISIRHRAYGHVLDLACGVGYGSYILSKNPDVKSVTGVDKSQEAIGFAKDEYVTDKTSFHTDLDEVPRTKFDVLTSIETIEHIEDTGVLPSIARRFQIPKLIVSFPHIKSTHFNKYHHHDFNSQQVSDLFEGWLVINEEKNRHDVTILEFVADPQHWQMRLE